MTAADRYRALLSSHDQSTNINLPMLNIAFIGPDIFRTLCNGGALVTSLGVFKVKKMLGWWELNDSNAIKKEQIIYD